MKKRMRKIMSLFLAVVLAFGMLPVSALADSVPSAEPSAELPLAESEPEPPAEAPVDELPPAPVPDGEEETPPATVYDLVLVAFNLEPADAALMVYDENGEAVEPGENGEYALTPGEYTYSAEKEGFTSESAAFTVTGEAELLQLAVTLPEAEAEAPAEEAPADDEGEAAEAPAAEFPGLPESFTLSAEQTDMKHRLAESPSISDFERMTAGKDYVENEIIFLADSEEDAQIYAEAFGGTLKRFAYGVATVTLGGGFSTEEAVIASADPDTALPAASPNHIIRLDPIEQEAKPVTPPSPGFTEESWQGETQFYDDPFVTDPSSYSYQWHLDAVSAHSYFDHRNGGSHNIKVAVLDTGINASHEEFAGLSEYNNLDVLTVLDGHDGYEDYDGSDLKGHGTHVSGIIAAEHWNGVGGCGISSSAVHLVSIQVLDKDGYSVAGSVAEGINLAVANDVDIINMSLGGVYYNYVQYEAVQNAYRAGITVIAAAGNDCTNSLHFPAAYDNVISVAATDRDGNRAYFSNYGPWVDIAAPGVDIISTYIGSASSYVFMNGTSMATPIVTGVAAALMNEYPELQNDPDAVLAMLQKYSTKTASKGIGKGIVNAYKTILDNTMGSPSIIEFTLRYNIVGSSGSFKTIDSDNITYAYGEYGLNIHAYDGKLYYTLNGKAPVPGSSYTYAGPASSTNDVLVYLTNKGKNTVKAMTVNADGDKSDVKTLTVNITVPVDDVAITDKVGTPISGCELAAGKSVQLYAKLTSENELGYTPTLTKPNWSVTENPGLASVSATGKVTVSPYAPTGSTITVRASADEAYCEYSITVTESITSLAFNTRSIELWGNGQSGGGKGGLGLSSYLLINGYKEGTDFTTHLRNITWTSSNPKILAMYESFPVVLGSGKVTVTAAATDGSGKKATLSVTAKVYSSGVTINGYEDGAVIAVARGKSLTLSAVAEPSAIVANKKVVWSGGSAENGITVSAAGKVTVSPGASGAAEITATPADGFGPSSSITVRVAEGLVTSVTMRAAEKKLTLFSFQPEAAYTPPPMSLQISPVVNGTGDFSGTLAYTSSKPSVATVDSSGNITAVSKGSATITAAATDGSGKKATCSVTVVKPIEGIEITGAPEPIDANAVGAGKSVTLKAIVTCDKDASNKKVMWHSSNTALASVSNGKVTVNKYYSGECAYVTITASDADGSSVYDRVNIPVTGGTVSSMSFSKSLQQQKLYCVDIPSTEASDNVLYLGGYLLVNAVGEFSNSTISWSSSNPSVIRVDQNGRATAGLYAGSATITAAAADGSGKKATVKLTVLVPASNVYITSALDEYMNDPALAYGRSMQFKASYGNAYGTPSKSEQKVTWGYYIPYLCEAEENWDSIKDYVSYSDYASYQSAYDSFHYDFYNLVSRNNLITVSSSGKLTVSSKFTNYYTASMDNRAIDLNIYPTVAVYVNTLGELYAEQLIRLVEPTTELFFYDGYTIYTNVIYPSYAVSDVFSIYYEGGTGAFAVTTSNPSVAGASYYWDKDESTYKLELVFYKPGTSKITLMSCDGTNKKATLNVTVRRS